MVVRQRQKCWVLLLLFITTAAVHCCPNPDTILPCHCASQGDEIQIWCSQSEVSKVLKGLKAVAAEVQRPIDELILEHNFLPSLPGDAFAKMAVVRLMLRENGLQRVTENWLAGLESTLVEIFIVEPDLRSIPDESLYGLTKLEAVTIHAGGASRIPNLSSLSKLRYLHTTLPGLIDFPVGRFPIAIEQIHMVSSPFLTRLESASFDDLPRLSLLNLTKCGLNWIHPRAFTRLPSLTELSLQENRITDAAAVGRAIRELPVLSTLRLDNNIIETLAETSFVDIPPLKEISLSGNNIRDIHRGVFHRLPALRKLDLNYNKIRRIHIEFFLQPYDSELQELWLVGNELDHVMQIRTILDALPRLRYLDLSHNRFQDITYGALRGHPSLERLDLDHNKLRRVVREAFTAMPALRELRLRNNSLSNYLEMPLWNLPALKGLDISYNEFHRLDRRVLANLPSLRRLDASGNNLVAVDAAAFLGTPSLEHVNLSHNAIQDFSPATFPHLSKLFELDAGDNRLRSMIPGLPRALEYLHVPRNQLAVLSPTYMTLPALKHLDITGNIIHRLSNEGPLLMPMLHTLLAGENAIQSLEENAIHGLAALETLDMHSNRIISIDDNALRELTKLKKLNLQGNRFDVLTSELLAHNKLLTSIDLSWNQMTSIASNALSNNRELEELDCSHNALSELPSDVLRMPKLRQLDVSYNRIQSLPSSLRSMTSLAELHLAKNKLQTLNEGMFMDMEHLEVLDIESNELQFVAPHSVRSLPNLVSLKLSRNRLTTLPSVAFSVLPALLSAELQENQLTDIASDAFTAVPHLLMLNLSYNQLAGFERAGLQGLHSLEVLDVSHNRLSRLTGSGLPSLQALVQLKIENNRLCNIQGSPFANMMRLRLLSLRNNKMTTLPEEAFVPLRENFVSFDIDGNPLRCSCNLLWLQTWLREIPHHGSEPRCHDGTFVKDYQLNGKDCRLEQNEDFVAPGCDNYPAVKLGSTQQLSAWLEMKETTRRPSPEESEYFYDEFVEENVTLPINLTSLITSTTTMVPTTGTSTSTTTAIPTIPPGVLSHFIPGDTPTLYAGSKKKPGTTTAAPQTHRPTSSFTFFGVPIPAINVGGFWGSSRNADGQGRFSSHRGRGRVQQLPPVMQDGFKPMLPGSGGFRPIFGPTNKSDEEYHTHTYRQEESFNYSQWDFPGNSLPHATISKVVLPGKKPQSLDQSPFNETSWNNSDYSLQKNITFAADSSTGSGKIWNKTEVSSTAQLHNFGPTNVASSTTTTAVTTITTTTWPVIITASPAETDFDVSTPAPQRNHESFLPTPVTSVITNKEGSQNSVFHATTSTTTSSSTTTQKPTNFLSDLWSSVTQSTGPSALSEFLAPGGQLPLYKPAGRPTITKVTVTPPSLEPGPLPMAEDLQRPIPRLAKSPPDHYYSPATTKSPEINESLSWYYNNYNRTNLEPYIGPGKILHSGQRQVDSLSYLVVLTVSLVCICYGKLLTL